MYPLRYRSIFSTRPIVKQKMDILSLERAQIINVFFVYVTLKIFFHAGLGVYDGLFASTVAVRVAAELKLIGQTEGLLSATGFLSAFACMILAYEGGRNEKLQSAQINTLI